MALATGAMASLLLKLGKLVKDEYRLQKGVKQDIQYLERELRSMHAALRKVGDVPRDQLDDQVKLWSDEVRDLSYKMEDVVDKFLVRVEGAEPVDKPHKLIKRLTKKMGDLFIKGKNRHDICSKIKAIKVDVQEAAERRDRYRVNDVVANPAPDIIDPRLLALYKDQKDLIGIDETLNKLSNMLTNEDSDVSKQLKTLSVVGFGGLGKTTLVKAVYDKIQTQFDCSAFVPVGRNPSAKKLLNDILFEIDKQKHRYSYLFKWDERQLINELRELLENQRYLIVIDDLWDTNIWETVSCAFVHNDCASRIITTTRIHDVAKKTGEVFKLEPLSLDLSEELFHTRLFGRKNRCPYNAQLPEVYDKILHKCGGVPLAIITMASLLVGKPVEYWSKVYNWIGFGNEDNTNVDNTRKIILFSYYDLPCHLKTCLLHLSIYPEDSLIDRDSLIWKWVAEGFVLEEPGVGLSEIGERYFNELINKSLIQPVETSHHGTVTSCRVHDMVLDVIFLLSKEENFVTSDVHASSPINARRLAVGWRSDPLPNKCLSQVRSFNAMCSSVMLPSLSFFQVLRVLALEGGNSYTDTTNFLQHVGKLVHLRYLGLEGMNIRELPKEIGDLVFLQTLNLGCKRLKELPESIGQLSQLKYLRTYARVPDWIGKLTSLEQLQINEVCMSSNFVKELGKLTELRKLHIRKTLHLHSASSMRDWSDSLVKLQKIQVIDIFQVRCVGYDDTICCWETSVSLSRQLRVLHMSYRQPGLLASVNPSLLPNLSHLSVQVDSPDLEIFGKFPELINLRLEMDGIYHHENMGAPGAFPKLRRLMTAGTPGRFVEGAMPSHESLQYRVEITPSSKVGGFNFDSLVNLPMLEEVTVEIWYAHGEEHRLAEVAVRQAIKILPNPPILMVETFPKLDLPTKLPLKGNEPGSKKRKKDLSWYDRYGVETSRWTMLTNHRKEQKYSERLQQHYWRQDHLASRSLV